LVLSKLICLLRRFKWGFIGLSTKFSTLFQNFQKKYTFAPTKKTTMNAIIKTSKGDMKVEFFNDDAPTTVGNFIKLAKDGYFDGLKWHRVIPDFVIQGGCPNTREGESGMPGTGGPGYQIDCELNGGNQHHDRGVLSMAHAGKDTGGSQFFVCHSRNNTSQLDGVHTCFGKVIDGLEVIDSITEGDAIEQIVVL
jgi:peptidyl-prolyl cis-trans isomerase B (cyclophilin B)